MVFKYDWQYVNDRKQLRQQIELEVEIANLRLSKVFYVKQYLQNHPHYVGVEKADQLKKKLDEKNVRMYENWIKERDNVSNDKLPPILNP